MRLERVKERGFTLLETLLALALVSLMLIAMNAFVFSMGELWGFGSEKRQFDQHATAMTRFLEAELRAGVMPPATKMGDPAITVPDVKLISGLTEKLLTFTLPAGSRLIAWPDDRPLPDVVCSLQVRPDEGLILLWHSTLETNFAEDAPRETVISPHVTGMLYDYFDADLKSWKTETELRNDDAGNPEVPQRLRLKFAFENIERSTILTLPSVKEGLPNF